MSEEQIVELPVAPLFVRALGGPRRGGGIRMDVQRELARDVADAIAVVAPELGQRVARVAAAEGALEVHELDHRDLRVLRALRRAPGRVHSNGLALGRRRDPVTLRRGQAVQDGLRIVGRRAADQHADADADQKGGHGPEVAPAQADRDLGAVGGQLRRLSQGSTTHVALQPSPFAVLLSSHASPAVAFVVPSPQRAIVQLASQKFDWPALSHCSFAAWFTWPSPQDAGSSRCHRWPTSRSCRRDSPRAELVVPSPQKAVVQLVSQVVGLAIGIALLHALPSNPVAADGHLTCVGAAVGGVAVAVVAGLAGLGDPVSAHGAVAGQNAARASHGPRSEDQVDGPLLAVPRARHSLEVVEVVDAGLTRGAVRAGLSLRSLRARGSLRARQPLLSGGPDALPAHAALCSSGTWFRS